MNNNNRRRGFTLIELLGVIVILLILVLITTPIVINYLKKAGKDAKTVQNYTIIESAKSWMSSKDNISLMPASDNECIEVTLRELKEQGYIDYDIKDPETKELLSDDITVIIRKVDNDLTYEINDGTQVCNTIIDSTYPRWTYVSSNKTEITKNDTVVVKIKGGVDISSYNLATDDITVKVGSTIVDNAIINNISCTGTSEIICDVSISNIAKDGRLNLVIDKDTLTNTNDKKSRVTPVLTDVVVDNNGPVITYVNKNNTNTSVIYANSSDEITIIFDTKDANISTAMLETTGIDIYVENEIKNVTKSLTRVEVEGGYRYSLTLTNVTGDGELSIKIKGNQISDTLGNKNSEKIITPGVIIDNTFPVVTLNPNGTTEYQISASTKITATDLNGIKEPINYTWSTNSNATTYNQTVSNEGTVKISDATGDYYLIVNACDKAGNCTREVSSKFQLNNEAPEVVFIPNGNSNYETKKDVVIKAISNGPALNLASLKYVITNNTNDNPTREFSNNETIKMENLSGTYYIVAEACDVLNNCTRSVSNSYKLDSEAPHVIYQSKTNTNRTAGQAIEYATKNDTITIVFEGTDNISYLDSLTANNITVRVNGNAVNATKVLDKTNITNGKRYTLTLENVTGEGQLSIQIDKTRITDAAGNQAIVGVITPGIIIDNEAPTITYGTNGNNTYAKSQSSTISVSDNREVNTSENKYIWSTSNTATPTTSFTSGSNYTKNGVTGDYYIVATACDKAGNCTTKYASNVFKIDNTKPTITFDVNGNSTANKSQTSKITVRDDHAGGDTTTYKYIWSTNTNATPNITFVSGNSYTQNSGDGNYYIIATACDNAGNCQSATSKAFLLDNTAPSCNFSGENTTWTTNNVSVKVTCSDTNGCKSSKSTNTWTYTSGTHKIEAISYEIEDNAGNTKTCSKNASIYVDKEGPTIPTNGSIGTVSGTDATGVIETPASGSTDAGVGGVTYRYLVNTTGVEPTNTNSGFKTSMNFERSCGTSYYGYVIAIDALGNRSAVKYIGTTSDGEDRYSEWSACTVTCGGGTQTRTNTCALVTTGLSQACNQQACCQMPSTTEWEYNYTGGVQTFTVPEDGTYKLEVYGAQGGNYQEAIGGKGGYATGNVTLTKGSKIYVAIGGKGNDGTSSNDTSVSGGYNGGGAGYTHNAYSRTWYGAGGGGATHIGTFNSTLVSHGNTNGLYIVAGGGGGAMYDSGGDGGGGQYPQSNHNGGSGGGINGENGHAEESQIGGYGGKQNEGGGVSEVAGHTYGYLFNNITGSFGQGGGYYTDVFLSTNRGAIAGGGGGYYGGGGGWVYAAGGGGSGYIGGVTAGSMDNGVRTGNGYAKITLVKLDCDTSDKDIEGPVITFGTNENNTYQKSQSSTITVTDNVGVDASTLKYVWTNNPSGATPNTSFTNGGTVTKNTGTGNYYIKATACDVNGNCTTTTSNVFKLDNQGPTITFGTNGNSTYQKSQSTSINVVDNHSRGKTETYKYIWSTSTSATPNESFISGETYSISDVSGNYYIRATACDNAGNCTTTTSNVFKLDNTSPTITFGTDGNSTYQKSQSSKITVTGSNLDTSSYKYIWSTNVNATANTSFTSGSSYTKDSVTGNYYLIATACNTVGNCTTKVSNVFKFDNTAPTITFGTNGNSSALNTQTSTINVVDNHSGGDTTTYKYIWSTSTNATPNVAFISGNSYSQSAGNGNYYITATACDNAGNCASNTSNKFLLDNTAPSCNYSGENTTWTTNNVSVTVTCSDTNGCKSSKSTKTWSYTSGTHKTETISYEIEDNAGNTKTCSKTAAVYVDKEGPTTPSCSVPTVSGTNTIGTASIASGSTDTGVGGITYKYLINNTGIAPANTNSGFDTNRTFERSCGTSYYEYTIAVDALGNKSAVKYCGIASDGEDRYSEWSACTKNGSPVSCGSGIQTRTNTCALITDDLETECSSNESCCTFTTIDFEYTGGVQSWTVPEGCQGTYKLEVWGAQGGNASYLTGGLGGYTSGNTYLGVGSTIYIVVGGAGSSTSGGYNGGGSGRAGSWDGPIYLGYGGGGGATHMGKTSDLLRNINIDDLYLVGGGGGGGYDKGVLSEWSSEKEVHRNGYAGGAGSGGGPRGSAAANCGSGYSSGINGYGGTSWNEGVDPRLSEAGIRSGNGFARITYIDSGYTVTFNPNGGTVNPSTKTVYASNSVIGEMPTPTNGNKLFLGWYTDETLNTIAYPTTPVYDDITLYAKWMDGCSVDFDYTGNVVGIKVPATGTYKLEVWGAQGGSATYAGGAGGYAYGNTTLTADSYVYVAVGGAGANGGVTHEASEEDYVNNNHCHGIPGGFNGGGDGYWGCFHYGMGVGGGAGGGATHIGKTATTLPRTSISDVFIVAGGGGGGGFKTGWTNEGEGYTNGSAGGVGGGQSGGTSAFFEMPWGSTSGTGGTQSTGYAYGSGGSGQGGGGGGYYGGTSGFALGGGGGSGYIGGVTSGSMVSGVRSGNGHAKITFVDSSCGTNVEDGDKKYIIQDGHLGSQYTTTNKNHHVYSYTYNAIDSTNCPHGGTCYKSTLDVGYQYGSTSVICFMNQDYNGFDTRNYSRLVFELDTYNGIDNFDLLNAYDKYAFNEEEYLASRITTYSSPYSSNTLVEISLDLSNINNLNAYPCFRLGGSSSTTGTSYIKNLYFE